VIEKRLVSTLDSSHEDATGVARVGHATISIVTPDLWLP
jgi:hypothetical protein